MALTAVVTRDDDPSGNTPRWVDIELKSDGVTFRTISRIMPAGVNAQAVGDAKLTHGFNNAKKRERESAVKKCMDGENPDTIALELIARPKLWETMTRRLHNGPRNDMPADELRGLAQWVVNRATPAIRADLNNVRSNGEVNALKAQWTSLLTGVDDFDLVDEGEV